MQASQMPGNVDVNQLRTAAVINAQAQLRDRAAMLTASIKELEKQALTFQQQGCQGRTEVEYFQEIMKLQNEIAGRKQVLLEIAQAMNLN